MENKDKTMDDRKKELLEAIDIFSKAYKNLEAVQLQENKKNKDGKYLYEDRLIPIGDQKTGAIGEFYALMYLRGKNPYSIFTLCENHSHKGYDIVEKDKNGIIIKGISVKTVSEFSKTRKTSEIIIEKEIEIDLHIISLNKEFKPNGYWILNGKVCDFKHKSITVSEENMKKREFTDKINDVKETLPNLFIS